MRAENTPKLSGRFVLVLECSERFHMLEILHSSDAFPDLLPFNVFLTIMSVILRYKRHEVLHHISTCDLGKTE